MQPEIVIRIVPHGNGRCKAFLADEPQTNAWDDTPNAAAGRLLLAIRERLGVRVEDQTCGVK